MPEHAAALVLKAAQQAAEVAQPQTGTAPTLRDRELPLVHLVRDHETITFVLNVSTSSLRGRGRSQPERESTPKEDILLRPK